MKSTHLDDPFELSASPLSWPFELGSEYKVVAGVDMVKVEYQNLHFLNNHFTMRRRRHDNRAAPVQIISGGEDASPLTVTMLGAGQEVGRSCCVIEHRGKKVVCDAGLHPAHPGMGSLPFIDELDWSTVDAILVTQWVQPAAALIAAFTSTTQRHCHMSWKR